MRIIFFSLVLMNVTYFIWQWQHPPEKQADIVRLSAQSSQTPSLVLLKELHVQKTKQAKAVETSKAQPVDEAKFVGVPPTKEGGVAIENAAKRVDECIAVSSFPDQAAGEQVVSLLTKRGISAKLNVSETSTGSDYLVYLPSFESRELAVRKLKALQAQAIDSFIIADGERLNGISLGIFVREESAKIAQSEFKAKGLSALIGNIPKTHREYEILLSSQQQDKLTDAVWKELSAAYSGKLTKKILPCN